MTAETTLRIARDCDNVIAIKEASGKMDQIERIIEEAPLVLPCIRAMIPQRMRS